MIAVTVNGNRAELPGPCSVRALLEHLGLSERPLLVELNELALLKSEWETRTVGDGDRIELVQFVAGG